MPPSTKLAPAFSTARPTLRAVSGAIALASTKMPSNPQPATSRASASAPCGGHTDSASSATLSARSIEPRSSSPAASARERVAALRPDEAHTTLSPRRERQAPIAEPISPGWSNATVLIDMSVAGRDDLDVLSAHVEKRRAHDLAVAELPDLRVGDGDELLGLDQVVGDARAGRELDVALPSVGSGQDRHPRLVRIWHGLAPRSRNLF